MLIRGFDSHTRLKENAGMVELADTSDLENFLLVDLIVSILFSFLVILSITLYKLLK